MSTLENAIDKLVRMEESFPVNELTWEGTRIWPLIRIQLWFSMTHSSSPSPEKKKKGEGMVSKSGSYRFLERLRSHAQKKWSAVLSKVNQGTSCFMQAVHAPSLHVGIPGDSADLLFLSRPEDYTDFVDGKMYNRHTDPLVEFACDDSTWMKVEFVSEEISDTLPRKRHTEFLLPLIPWTRFNLDRYLLGRNPLEEVNRLTSFQSFLSDQFSSVRLDLPLLRNRLHRLKHLTSYAARLLSRIAPEAVFMVSYYGNTQHMSVVHAAQKTGIPTVDIQHGKQGKYQGAYTHWTTVPEGGYELLPDYFWTWGEASRENILRWLSDHINTHQPVVGGNRWLAKWSKDPSLTRQTKVGEYLKQYERYTKRILVSLQPFLNTLPPHLLDAMKSAPQNWLWMLRLHPRQREELDRYATLCRNHDIEHVELHQATKLPLYALLKNVHHHVTCYSSVCYEALTFDVPTTIIHEIGASLYPEYIEKNHFLLALEKDELLDCIEHGLDRSNLTEERPYIEIDNERAQDALRQIRSNTSRSFSSPKRD